MKTPGRNASSNLLLILPALVAAGLLAGCQTAPLLNTTLQDEGETNIMRQVMERKNKIVHLSSKEIRRDKPVLLLVHGATDDPTEMLRIFTEWRSRYNVYLYSYNFHLPVRTVALDLAREMKALETEIKSVRPKNGPVENVTVVVYSYSAIIFRFAVILADDPEQFAHVSLIQLVPTAGGSYLAHSLGMPGAQWFIYPISDITFTENPYGRLAEKLWDGEGNRKFYEAINPRRTFSILVEADPHSLAGVHNEGVQRRYQNALGPNVVTIPASAKVDHDYFTANRVALEYLRLALERDPDETNFIGGQFAGPIQPEATQNIFLHSVPFATPGF